METSIEFTEYETNFSASIFPSAVAMVREASDNAAEIVFRGGGKIFVRESRGAAIRKLERRM